MALAMETGAGWEHLPFKTTRKIILEDQCSRWYASRGNSKEVGWPVDTRKALKKADSNAVISDAAKATMRRNLGTDVWRSA